LELVIDPYGNTESLASASGGEIGGLQTFISQVLDPAQKSLNFLANTLVTEANNIQSNGIDAYGEVGQNLFAIDPTVTNEAGGVHVVLNDGMRVATAAQFRVSENANNTSTVRSSVMYAKSPLPVGIGNTNLVNNPNPTAGVSIKVDGSKVYSPVSTMAAGMKATFYLDNAAPGQQLQVLTRDGRQLLGQSLTETEKFQMFTPANGFVADATYSDAYLNKVGDYSYRDMNVFYGAKAQVLYTQAFDKNLDETARLPEPAVLETGRIVPSVVAQGTNLIEDGAITINGIGMGSLKPLSGTLRPSDVADWVKSKSVETGVTAEVFNEVRVSVTDLDFNKPLKLNGQTIPPFSDLKSLVSSINNTSSAGVLATVNDNGELVLSPLTAGADIVVGPADDGGKPNNVLNVRASTYSGQVRLVQIADELRVNSGGVDFTKPLSINGVDILPDSNVTSAELLKTSIHNKLASKGVDASIDSNGVLVLKTTNGAPITIGPVKAADGTYQTNALGLEPMAYTVEERMKRLLVEDPTKSEIRISFGKYGNPEKIGTPADLAKIGIRTGAYIDGGTKDDLLVFVTGQGSATVAASYQGAPTDPRDSLRQQSLVVKFTAADRFTITDAATGTELANRHYDPSVLEPVIDYQGLQIKFTHAPGVGDSYQIDGNQDGLGNNVNMLVMADLAKKEVVNGKTLNNSYIDQINSVGNLAQQANITQQALTVVNDQAIASRDKVSGVNLDDEAAALIRYQQAYQAAAKALQVSGQLFDSIVQIR
jgi:flagellar hook-associated protein FlgK